MSAALKFLLVLTMILFQGPVFAQVSEFKIHTFTPAEIGFIGNTYSGDVHPNGMIYFANGDGLLEYDGVRWTNISPIGYTKVLSVLVSSSGLIYIGGMNNFGYLIPDDNFNYEYVSLREKLDSSFKQEEVWQIIEYQGNIYFQGYEQILKWDGDKFEIIDFPDAYIFVEETGLYASNFSGDFVEIKNDKILPAIDKLPINNDAVYSMEPLGKNKYLLFTAESGIYVYNASTRGITAWEKEVTNYLESPGLYHSLKFSDELFIATTWQHGVVFFDSAGKVLESYELELGIEKGGLRELFKGPKGDIWLCSDFGIVKLEFLRKDLVETPKPVFRKVLAEGVSYQPTIGENIVFDNRPKEFVVQVACPGFSLHELEFSYSTNADGSNWTEWSKEPEYLILDPTGGNYKVLARVRTPKGGISNTSTLNLQMPIIWYLDVLFYTMATLILVLFFLGVVRFRSYQLRRQNQNLEQQILDRTKEIELQKEELEIINQELKETNKELDNFVYRSSHDLTAPLKSIRGLIELSRLEKDNKKYLDLMEASLVRLENFIETVTAYSSNAKQELIIEDIKIKSIVEWVIEDLRFIDGFNKIKVETILSDDLRVMADKRTLYIILNNLINNAIKYHHFDKPDPWICISATISHSDIMIEVEDNGLGIKSDHLDKVFDMFYRGSERSEGSGLGLYIVREAVLKLGGKITVESTAGIGSKFCVQLPIISTKQKNAKAKSVQAV